MVDVNSKDFRKFWNECIKGTAFSPGMSDDEIMDFAIKMYETDGGKMLRSMKDDAQKYRNNKWESFRNRNINYQYS